ncbi:MAG: Gfo/Idh/MocA family oxidoreductase [Clostridia bacterium]|nr:Gfo/Idh/MocA family oxidoreductase [Clostridia bacterium]
MSKIYTVAILGVGARGGNAYGKLINKFTDKYNIVALCDQREDRLEYYGELFGVGEKNRFTSEEEFFKEKRADLLVIATPDTAHIGHTIKAFEVGYDILVEKPLTDSEEECKRLLAAQEKHGCRALVCHVLRYAPAYTKLYEIVNSGKIGRLIDINWTEPVGYWHQAHSYVRGNWRNTDNSAPMILAKCCHDLDLIQWYAKSKCKSISSIGSLDFFKKENAPDGATERCQNCPHKDSCPYSAYRIYIGRWHQFDCPTHEWPYNVVTAEPVSEEKIRAAIEAGPYGRCVFHCDNNVVDHQTVQMLFENGITATLHMNAFTNHGGRRVAMHGTYGELYMDEKTITLDVFGEPTEIIKIDALLEADYGHGGGDLKLVEALYEMMEGNAGLETSLEASVESHLMGIKAEESRLSEGKLLLVHN